MANGGIIGPVNDPTTTTVVNTFTSSGTYNYPNQATPGQVDYLVVAGGGAGGSTTGSGGGGAGGYRTSFPGGTKLTLSGGTSNFSNSWSRWNRRFSKCSLGTSGSPSIFSTSPSPITSSRGWIWRMDQKMYISSYMEMQEDLVEEQTGFQQVQEQQVEQEILHQQVHLKEIHGGTGNWSMLIMEVEVEELLQLDQMQ
jgi:hypothetical protein